MAPPSAGEGGVLGMILSPKCLTKWRGSRVDGRERKVKKGEKEGGGGLGEEMKRGKEGRKREGGEREGEERRGRGRNGSRREGKEWWKGRG